MKQDQLNEIHSEVMWAFLLSKRLSDMSLEMYMKYCLVEYFGNKQPLEN